MPSPESAGNCDVMRGDRHDLLLPRRTDYLIAALGTWIIWLTATGLAAAALSFTGVLEGLGVTGFVRGLGMMPLSVRGIVLIVALQFIIEPVIVRILVHYGLARIAIFMLAHAVVWLALALLPIGQGFGMQGVLREMGWLTLFLLWGGWNWFALALRPLKRALRVDAPAKGLFGAVHLRSRSAS
jgi:hypothetical protein